MCHQSTSQMHHQNICVQRGETKLSVVQLSLTCFHPPFQWAFMSSTPPRVPFTPLSHRLHVLWRLTSGQGSLGSSALLIRLIRRFQLYVLGDCYLLALAALGEGSAEKNDRFIQLQAGYSAFTRPFALLKRHKEEQQNKTKTKNKIISRSAGLWSSDLETKMFFFFTFTHLRASSTTLFFADHLGKDPPWKMANYTSLRHWKPSMKTAFI